MEDKPHIEPGQSKRRKAKLNETLSGIVLGLLALSAMRTCATSLTSEDSPECWLEQALVAINQSRINLYSLQTPVLVLLGDKFVEDGHVQFAVPTGWNSRGTQAGRRAVVNGEIESEYINGERIVFNSHIEDYRGCSWMIQVTTIESSNSHFVESLNEEDQLVFMCGAAAKYGLTREDQEANLKASSPTISLSLVKPMRVTDIDGRKYLERRVVYKLNEQQEVNGNDVQTQWLYSTIANGQWVKFYVNAFSTQAIVSMDDFVTGIASTLKVGEPSAELKQFLK